MFINLIVIRSAAMEQLVSFYEKIGLKWEYHRHGNSPFHYSSKVDKTVIEIYPLAKDQQAIDQHLRLGFSLERFEDVITCLKHARVAFVAEPATTDCGTCAIVKDPEGRREEICKSV